MYVCVFMYVMHAICGCLHWKANAEWLNLQQLNVSALFLKAEVSGHTRSTLGCPWGAMQLKAILLRGHTVVGEGWGCFEWLRPCTEGKWGQRI